MSANARRPVSPTRKAASFRKRLGSDAIDLLGCLLIGWCLYRLNVGYPDQWPPRHFDVLDHLVSIIWSHWPLWVHGVAYTVISSLVLHAACRAVIGHSPGEYLVGIQLINCQGEPAGFIRGLTHGLGLLLGLSLLGGGYLWAIADRRKQNLAEYISGTRLIESN